MGYIDLNNFAHKQGDSVHVMILCLNELDGYTTGIGRGEVMTCNRNRIRNSASCLGSADRYFD